LLRKKQRGTRKEKVETRKSVNRADQSDIVRLDRTLSG
jgi:hypothetical protein